MKQWKSMDDILDFAISEEEGAARLYKGLAEQMKRPQMRQVFLDFAKEEMAHKVKLLQVQAGQSMLSAEEKVPDLRIGDYLLEVDLDSGMDYRQALVLAMKKEKAAFQLYTDLAATAQDDEVRQLFLCLADEEAKHKLRFELEYNEVILTEN